MDTISFEDFKKVEIKVGQILSAEKIEGSEKLLKLSVDFMRRRGRARFSLAFKSISQMKRI
jgi:tRNA-binding EMAP/Myf-like protein